MYGASVVQLLRTGNLTASHLLTAAAAMVNETFAAGVVPGVRS